jgi:hypothetical protein
MYIKIATLCAGAFLALTPFMARPLLADDWNRKVEFEFSGPVQVPGKTLAAGKYAFQLADGQSERNIVDVFSEDSNGIESLVATLIAVPAYRADTPDRPVANLEEQPSGSPEAIQRVFYPGEHTGWEFIYPKGQTAEAN